MNYNSNFVIEIKNAVRAKRREVLLPLSKFNKEIGKVLVREGFLEEIKEEKNMIMAKLKYDKRTPRFSDVVLISKPSLRSYIGAKEILNLERKGKKTIVISTSQGLMTGKEAYKKGLGGEVLFAIW
ncbi:MAG: 30S ribosomal protein S8 [Patescibacteria group bacterium]